MKNKVANKQAKLGFKINTPNASAVLVALDW